MAWRGYSQLEELQEQRCGDGNEAGMLRVREPLKDRKSQVRESHNASLSRGKVRWYGGSWSSLSPPSSSAPTSIKHLLCAKR